MRFMSQCPGTRFPLFSLVARVAQVALPGSSCNTGWFSMDGEVVPRLLCLPHLRGELDYLTGFFLSSFTRKAEHLFI